ncbi:MAG: hypothetical protein ACYC6Y_22710 [Thermoguttaceae bacterium]
MNQRETPKIDGLFHPLGRFELTAGQACSVVISNEVTDGHVMVDAVQVVPVGQ